MGSWSSWGQVQDGEGFSKGPSIMALMKHLSEMILACSYFFIGVDLNAHTLFRVYQGLYNLREEDESIQEGKRLLAEG